MSSATREEVARYLIPANYAKGQIIYRQGDPPIGMYLIRKGRVALFTSTNAQREVMLLVLDSGMQFGEVAVLNNGVRTTSARALTPVELWLLPKDIYLNLLRSNAEIAMQQCIRLANYVRLVYETMAVTRSPSVRQRLAKMLLNTASFLETDEIAMTQEVLASLAGASRQSVNAVLADWASEGWVELQHGKIILADRHAIERQGET